MSDTRLSIAAAQSMANAHCDAVDVGAGSNGVIKIYSGSAPSDVDGAETGTLLVTFNLQATAFNSAVDQSPGARCTLQGVPLSATVAETGTAGYFRIYNADDEALWQGDVSTTGGGGDLTINSVALQQDATAEITSYTWDQPQS